MQALSHSPVILASRWIIQRLPLIEYAYEDFQVSSLLMKIQKDAVERQKLIKTYQFVTAKDECNISFEDYYIRY